MRCSTQLAAVLAMGAVSVVAIPQMPLRPPLPPEALDLDADREPGDFMPVSTSKGIMLGVTVLGEGALGTDGMGSNINGAVVQAYHMGAGSAVAVLHDLDKENPGRVFYLNGTVDNHSWVAGRFPERPLTVNVTAVARDYTPMSGTLLSDSGQPQVPYGLIVESPATSNEPLPTEHGVILKPGPGTAATEHEETLDIVNLLGYGTFLACNRTVAYYNRKIMTLNFLYADHRSRSRFGPYEFDYVPPPIDFPAECVPIGLVALCAHLPPLEQGSLSNHDFAQTLPCYVDDAVMGPGAEEAAFAASKMAKAATETAVVAAATTAVVSEATGTDTSTTATTESTTDDGKVDATEELTTDEPIQEDHVEGEIQKQVEEPDEEHVQGNSREAGDHVDKDKDKHKTHDAESYDYVMQYDEE